MWRYCRLIGILTLTVCLISCATASKNNNSNSNNNSNNSATHNNNSNNSNNNSNNNNSKNNNSNNHNSKNNSSTNTSNNNSSNTGSNNNSNNTNSSTTKPTKTPGDPYEKYNRKIFKFNMMLDKDVLRPFAQVYEKVTPDAAQGMITHFFDNLDLVPTVANDAIQLNMHQALEDSSRFLVNSTVGIGGLFDVATPIKIPYHHNDFGLTMARYGDKRSDYLMLPFFGPSTVRDSIGDPINIYLSIWPYINPAYVSYTAMGFNKFNQRVQLLAADKLVEQAFDPYVFVRSAYLQHRQAQINQLGKPIAKGKEITNDIFTGANATDTSGAAGATAGASDSGDTFVAADANDKSANPPAGASEEGDTYVPADGESTSTTTSKAGNLPDPEMPDYINKKFREALKRGNTEAKEDANMIAKKATAQKPEPSNDDTYVSPATPAQLHSLLNMKHHRALSSAK